MQNQNNGRQDGVALYTFFDGDTLNKYSRNPNLDMFLRIKGLNKLLSLAFNKYFYVDTDEENIFKHEKDGLGFFEGVYFSTSSSWRAICVAVSDKPIGVKVQLGFPTNGDFKIDEHFSKYELKEYYENPCDETLFYIMCRKRALRNKRALLFSDDDVDSCDYLDYTMREDSFEGKKYFFASTDVTEFVKVDVKTLFP